jgi:hypothetical protein
MRPPPRLSEEGRVVIEEKSGVTGVVERPSHLI